MAFDNNTHSGDRAGSGARVKTSKAVNPCSRNYLRATGRPLTTYYVFVHIATMGAYREVVSEIFETLLRSGLSAAAQDVFLGIVGEGEVVIPANLKCTILFRYPKVEQYEFPTLQGLQESMQGRKDAAVLYLHTKGATVRPQDKPTANDWRRYMLHFVVERFEECLARLADHDVCGVDWRTEPKPHFSGNFWWARGDYIAALPRVSALAAPEADWIISRRHNAEFWIGMGPNVRAASLFDSGIDVYRRYLHRLPRDWYENRLGRPMVLYRFRIKYEEWLDREHPWWLSATVIRVLRWTAHLRRKAEC